MSVSCSGTWGHNKTPSLGFLGEIAETSRIKPKHSAWHPLNVQWMSIIIILCCKELSKNGLISSSSHELLSSEPGRKTSKTLSYGICSLKRGPWYYCITGITVSVLRLRLMPHPGKAGLRSVPHSVDPPEDSTWLFRPDSHCIELEGREIPAAYSSKPQAWKQIPVCLHSVWTQKLARDLSALILVFLLTSCVTLGCMFSLELRWWGDLDWSLARVFELQMLWFQTTSLAVPAVWSIHELVCK